MILASRQTFFAVNESITCGWCGSRLGPITHTCFSTRGRLACIISITFFTGNWPFLDVCVYRYITWEKMCMTYLGILHNELCDVVQMLSRLIPRFQTGLPLLYLSVVTWIIVNQCTITVSSTEYTVGQRGVWTNEVNNTSYVGTKLIKLPTHCRNVWIHIPCDNFRPLTLNCHLCGKVIRSLNG